MRNYPFLIIAFCCTFRIGHAEDALSVAESAQRAGYSITASGAHHRVWSRLTFATNEAGTVTLRTNSFVQLATGLNRWDGKKWVESQAELVETPNGIAARGAQHTADFDANINSSGSVRIKMPDGHWFKGHPLCLAYYDSSTGTNVYIGMIQDSTALIVGSNRVVFPNAFSGVDASVNYTFTRAGISQDIRFHTKPPSPESFGLNPETTHLLAFTEVTESPQPNLRERSWKSGLETEHDQTIDFGAMRMIPGRAFRASNSSTKSAGVPVMKKWEKIEGRNFIIEDLRWDQIKSDLEVLPLVQTNSVSAATNASIIRNQKWYALKGLPPSPKASNRASRPAKLMAWASNPNDFVLDWELVNQGANLWYFGCYTTWLLDGYYNLNDAHFFSQAVIKYTPGSSLDISGSFYWHEGGTCGDGPAILTAVNDDEVGEHIPYGGTPHEGDYGPALYFANDCSQLQNAVGHFDIRYASEGLASSCMAILSVEATQSPAIKGETPEYVGTFKITRGPEVPWTANLPLQIEYSGSAVAGTGGSGDYHVTGTATIPAGQASTTITVHPHAPIGDTFEKTVILTVKPDPLYMYRVWGPRSATVYVDDPSVPAPSPVSPPSGLISWWRGEDNAYDAMGANNGTFTANYQYAYVERGFAFDGAANRFTANGSGSLNLGSGDFSIEAWIRPMTANTMYGVQSIVDKRYTPNDYTATGYSLHLVNGHLQCQIAVNGAPYNFGPPGPDLRDGRFHHVALSLVRNVTDGGHLYVDGVALPAFNPTVAQGNLNNNQSFRIGNHASTTLNANFTGVIDEVAIYNRALSVTEIQSIYTAGRGGKCNDLQISQQPVDNYRLVGEGVTFTVAATGQTPISYQWKKNGVPLINGGNIAGATSPTLTISGLATSDAGVYTVDINNAGCARRSLPAVLKVCPPALSVTAYKRSCEDRYYFDVYNLSGVNLQGGSFKLLVYFVTEAGTLYATLLPWSASDVLPNGGHHLFTLCSSDNLIMSYYCVVIYDGATCLSSPKFQVAPKTDLALQYANTTQAKNFCSECNPPTCQEGDPEWLFPLEVGHPNCPFNNGCPCGTWPLTAPVPPSTLWTLPISAHDGPSIQIQDNFYKVSGVNVDVTCPKKGFKNVYGIKQWQGIFGPKSEIAPTLSSMSGNGNCQTPSLPINNPDTTKYLSTHAEGIFTDTWEYGQGGGVLSGSVSRDCSIDRYTGKATFAGDNTGDEWQGAVMGIANVRLADLPGVYIHEIGSIAPTALAPNGSGGVAEVPITPTYTDGAIPSMSWSASWNFTLGDEDCSITFVGHNIGYVWLDLSGGSYSYSLDYYESDTGDCGPDSGTSWKKSLDSGYINVGSTGVSSGRDWSFDDSNPNHQHHWAQTRGSISYTNTYSSDQVNADVDTLLSKWNLLDDIEYPWRADGGVTSGPLVTYNERANAPSVLFDLINTGTEEDPVWQAPVDNSPPPWPSQPPGAIIGAPLPVHGPNGALYAYEPYYNFYHRNWIFVDTGRGSPQGFIDSYGAKSPLPNATQWVDADQARCFPGGPFWAFGSEIEGSGDHFMFRFKDPYITDTDNEWEQGGYGAGCLIKCKWAETIKPITPEGEDFIFKQWHFNFRDFISSYYWNSTVWSRNNIEIPGGSTCPALSPVAPVRYTPIDIPVGQPWAGYYIGRGSWYISQMDCTVLHAGSPCCQTAVYVEPNPPSSACNNGVGDGVFVAMPPAVCDARFGSLWMGRVDQTTPDSHVCDNYVANRNNGVANPDACDPQIELDPIFHSHNHAYETFVAPLSFPPGSAVQIDLDIDSDNNNGFNSPDRRLFEDQIEDDDFRPGKLVWVNTADCDLDGIPDFADGFNWDGTAGNDDDANTPSGGAPNNRFVPLVLQLGAGVNLSTARLKITYNASDPAGVTHNGTPPVWKPAAGNLRIWKKNGDQARNKSSAKGGGDYVDPGVYAQVSQLGFSAGNRVVTLFVEGIQLSTAVSDQRILVELDPDGDGPEGWNLSDAVRVTVIGAEFVEAVGNTSVQTVSVLSDSHAAPYFEGGVAVILGTPQVDANGKLIGSIQLIGRLRSDLCDLIKGDQGTLGDILVSLNGEPLTADPASNISVHKNDLDPAHPSLTHPYATYTDFNLVFNNVEVSTGLNWLRLAVADSVSGSGLTGFAEYSWTVTATLLPAAGPEPPWQFENSLPVELSRSERGEIHPYYLRLIGPPAVLPMVSGSFPRKFVTGPEGSLFVASDRDTPEVHVLTALQKARLSPTPTGPLDSFEEELGFYYGFSSQAVDDVKGVFKFAKQVTVTSFNYMKVYQDLKLGTVDDYDIRVMVDYGTKAEQLSAAAKTAWNLWSAANRSEWGTLAAAAEGNLPEAWRQSETCRWLAAYMVEAMVAVHNQYVESSPFKRGEIEGRVTLEVVLIVLPFTKVAQLSKVAVLTKLTEIQWIKDNAQLLNILTKVLELAKGNKPVPPIIGLPPTEVPALRVGSEIGNAGERVSGKLAIKFAEDGGTARRAKALDAMLNELPNAGEYTVAHRIGTYQRAAVARCAEIPTPAQYADLLRYRDFDLLKQQKAIARVMVDDASDPGMLTQIDGFVRQDWQVGHHWPPVYVQKRFREMGVQIADVDDAPVQVCIELTHGKGGSPASIHNLMNNGPFPEDAAILRGLYQTPQQMMDELLRFVKNSPDEDVKPFVKALRGWAQDHSVPFSE